VSKFTKPCAFWINHGIGTKSSTQIRSLTWIFVFRCSPPPPTIVTLQWQGTCAWKLKREQHSIVTLNIRSSLRNWIMPEKCIVVEEQMTCSSRAIVAHRTRRQFLPGLYIPKVHPLLTSKLNRICNPYQAFYQIPPSSGYTCLLWLISQDQ
jgi:hypothetical protein